MKCNTCQNELYCYDDNHQLTRDRCADNGFAAYVPQTNADRIRGMTDEELADFLVHVCDWNWREWLKSPVEEVQDELKPCPFCGGKDIRFSVKRTGHFERVYHAAMYCNGCHCYGARIHTAPVKNDYSSRIEVENDKTLKYYAAEAWNRRADNG